ncbi:MAG: hypothetical protein R2878_01065 [Thermoleophilia bacterium]
MGGSFVGRFFGLVRRHRAAPALAGEANDRALNAGAHAERAEQRAVQADERAGRADERAARSEPRLDLLEGRVAAIEAATTDLAEQVRWLSTSLPPLIDRLSDESELSRDLVRRLKRIEAIIGEQQQMDRRLERSDRQSPQDDAGERAVQETHAEPHGGVNASSGTDEPAESWGE